MEELKILCTSVNEKGDRIAIGTTYGFAVYSMDNGTFTKVFNRTFRKGIGAISVLDDSNVISFAGGGKNPYVSNSTVVVFDDKKNAELFKETFPSRVLRLKMTRKILFIVFQTEVKIYKFATNEIINIETDFNGRGCLEYNAQSNLLLLPNKKMGEIVLSDLQTMKQTILKCHKHNVTNFTTDRQVSLLCSSSVEGLMVRLWNLSGGEKVKEFQRGLTTAQVLIIAIDPDKRYVLVYSSDLLVSIFDIQGKAKSKWYSSVDAPVAQIKVEQTCVNILFIGNGEFVVLHQDGSVDKYKCVEANEIVVVETIGTPFCLFDCLE
ncbi:hypothetical protein EIN_430430 [Entamoeba invadens IP1]|uniref:WD repeat domain phosphoinositide-interacting protein n=1 Tax=Entamoeba invadens IP1 TaxID=370355 RepID=A0A0A1UHF6_ENTIV|nr:hypothetical protein EIN_430430 [Entamoeba invadens IP1]ELP95237.1 hypothetical protein EIN_430430 [Entamoeba invadens IP1]|eukprot:XP_004262008.1 hypothetical protein EIN_430430 [Entamoeba invadens IP1]